MTVTNPRVPEARVEVDWMLNGWDESTDVVTDDVRNTPGITTTRGKDSARPRGKPMVSSASFTLGNTSKRYSAENAGSDIYQFTGPDRPTRISIQPGLDLDYDDATIDYDEVDLFWDAQPTVNIFKGLSEEPEEHPSRDERNVTIGALGSMANLRGVKVSTLLHSAIRTDEAIDIVLDAALWPAADRVLSVGDVTMEWWWLDQEDAWDALVSLVETEGSGASLYEDGQGRVVFENRNYRSTEVRSTSSQGTYLTTSAGGGIPFVNYSYKQNMRDVFNDVRMTIKRRVAQPTAKIWEYGEPLVLGPSELRTVFAHGSDPWSSVEVVTNVTDYVVSAGGLLSVTTNASGATANTAVITFVATAAGATILGPGSATSGFQIRGNAVTVVSEETVYQDATFSIGVTRVRSMNLADEGARQEISKPTAIALANAAAEYYREARPTISIEFVNASAAILEQMLAREISDRITIHAGANEFQGDIWIEQINFGISIGGRLTRMGIIGSKAQSFTASPALWDSGLWDTGTWGV